MLTNPTVTDETEMIEEVAAGSSVRDQNLIILEDGHGRGEGHYSTPDIPAVLCVALRVARMVEVGGDCKNAFITSEVEAVVQRVSM